MVGMSDERLIHHYNDLLSRQDDDHAKVGWGSAKGQARRFEVFLDIGDLSDVSILDVGCGLGALLGFLNERRIHCAYQGIDINPRMVEQAQARHPEATFRVMTIDDVVAGGETFDYVLSSGMLTIIHESHLETVHRTIKQMVAVTRKGVGINFLSSRAETINEGERYVDPGTMLNFCLALSSRVVVRHDYMPHDVTFFIYSDAY